MRQLTSALALFFLSAPAFGDEITLYNYLSAGGMNWSTPQGLAQSALRNVIPRLPDPRFPAYAISHVNIEVTCEATDERRAFHILTGAAAKEESDQAKMLFWDGAGFGVLLSNFEGRLMKKKFIEKENARLGDRPVNFLSYKISSETCQRLREYYREYVSLGFHETYGLTNRPRYGEGASCGNLGASFLEIAGLLTPYHHAFWKRSLRVPPEYVGDPEGGVRINPLHVLFWDDSRWAEPEEPHHLVEFWDPEKMFAWVQASKALVLASGGLLLDYEIQQRRGFTGIWADRSDVPTPDEPFWLED